MPARTPMLQQYFDAKAAHPGVLMAMRVGDFYEFYGEDAETAAAALEITLTGREDGENGRIAMAGVPFHSVERYLAKLVSKGYKVALCDQIEDPKMAKGLVKRAVTRVLTPGTVVEESMLSGSANNFLCAAFAVGEKWGLATLDPSTAEFLVTELPSAEWVTQELARLRPAELLVAAKGHILLPDPNLPETEVDFTNPERAVRSLSQRLGVSSLDGFGMGAFSAGVVAAEAALRYAVGNGLELGDLFQPASYSVDQFMAIDPATRRALELTTNLSDGSRRFTLFAVLDVTVTSTGSRLLKKWIEQPLLNGEAILARQDAVAVLVRANLDRADLRDALKRIADIERLVSRCAARLAGPRDLAALRATLLALPDVLAVLGKLDHPRLHGLAAAVGDHRELASFLEHALEPDPPVSIRDGGVIRTGYHEELDQIRALSREGRGFIAEVEQRERERTGITTLKVGFNSVFGYYLEVGKQHQSKVPADYVRKQTTTNAERYFTAELKDLEASVLGAGERALTLESSLFDSVRSSIAAQARPLLEAARAIAELDVLAAFAEVSAVRGYRRPVLVDEDILEIEQGRHPIVEANTTTFVPNDTRFTPEDLRLMLLTGPNMSGKSTYLRQTALIALMAQIGCFVPARSCRWGLCDRIFARIGAKDEIALGQSTFMVEMVESAFILNHATERSLVVFDEVGRGTSTYDGLAIAWAMIEFLCELGAKTMFATHYHQLNALSGQIKGIGNFRVSVREVGDEIVWTHRVLPGGTDRSYGIYVAQKAGMPRPVLERAREVLGDLEETKPAATPKTKTKQVQLTLFEAEDPWIVKELDSLDVMSLTPLEAIQILGDWKQRSKGD